MSYVLNFRWLTRPCIQPLHGRPDDATVICACGLRRNCVLESIHPNTAQRSDR